MLHYLLKRSGSLLATLLVASLIVFIVIEVVPGDPASYLLGMNAQPDTFLPSWGYRYQVTLLEDSQMFAYCSSREIEFFNHLGDGQLFPPQFDQDLTASRVTQCAKG